MKPCFAGARPKTMLDTSRDDCHKTSHQIRLIAVGGKAHHTSTFVWATEWEVIRMKQHSCLGDFTQYKGKGQIHENRVLGMIQSVNLSRFIKFFYFMRLDNG